MLSKGNNDNFIIFFAKIIKFFLPIQLFSVTITWLNMLSLGIIVSKFQIIATLAKMLSIALIIGGGFYRLIFESIIFIFFIKKKD